MLTLLRAADYPVMPWKNGGGTTSEILIEPPGADMANFDWRVSTARIDEASDFSRFPGVDWTLIVLSGAMSLRGAVGERQQLDANIPPFAFPGEDEILPKAGSIVPLSLTCIAGALLVGPSAIA
jgi:uncharacterized protein